MLSKNYVFGGAVFLSGALLLSGCGSSDSGMTANSPAPTTASTDSTPAATTAPEEPQRSSTAPVVKPPKGFGNAQGRVLWNEKPAVNVKVTLCTEFSFMGGCSGKMYTARTDKDGNYTVDKVPPGDYSLAVQLFDTDTFIYPTTGILSAAKFKVEEGKTLDIRATNLFKVDLQIISPKVDETVKSGLPKLTWKPYGGAENYEVTLSDPNNGADTQSLKTSSTSIAPEKPLLNGTYQWEVVARNANGVKIASTDTYTKFKVVGQAGSTKVDLIAPHADALIDGKKPKFSWKAHPLANGYQIYVASEKNGPIVSFEKVDATEYILDKTLEPGSYSWSVSATKDGQKLAASDLVSIRVK